MGFDDPVDMEAMIFTEADVFMIAGFLSVRWGLDDEHDATEDVEEAITAILSQGKELLDGLAGHQGDEDPL